MGASPPPSPAQTSPADSPEPHLGHRTLRRYNEGVLAFGDRRAPVRFVLDRTSGQVVMPIEPAALSAKDHVLLLPAETACVLQVLLVVSELPNPAGHEAPDRWKAYHAAAVGAPPPSGLWAIASMEAAKTETLVFPSEELQTPNSLSACEHRLIRELNTSPDRVGRACKRLLGVDVQSPMVVGIDPLGADVRARFGVLRLEFATWSRDEADARASLATILDSETTPHTGDSAGNPQA